ncbi:outer membrane beta-barrel protein [Spiribacter sp. 218]|uniref:outer membrane protein n=1 Tax=Spiribacter pallidus TaxID=1987936 RepID=UPI00349F3A3A
MKKGLFAAALAFVAIPVSANGDLYIEPIYSFADANGMDLTEGSVTSGSVSLSTSVDDSGNALGFAGGYLFENGFGFEGGYAHFKDFSATADASFNNATIGGDTLNGDFAISQDIDGDLFYLAPVAYIDADKFRFKTKAGVARFDVDNAQTISGSGTLNGSAVSVDTSLTTISESGTSYLIGASAEYRFTDQISASLGYMRFSDIGGGELEETDVDNINVSLLVYFE